MLPLNDIITCLQSLQPLYHILVLRAKLLNYLPHLMTFLVAELQLLFQLWDAIFLLNRSLCQYQNLAFSICTGLFGPLERYTLIISSSFDTVQPRTKFSQHPLDSFVGYGSCQVLPLFVSPVPVLASLQSAGICWSNCEARR